MPTLPIILKAETMRFLSVVPRAHFFMDGNEAILLANLVLVFPLGLAGLIGPSGGGRS
jgi:hypothetical protein